MIHEQQVIWGRTGVMVNAPVSGGLLNNELEISGFESQVRRLSISKHFAPLWENEMKVDYIPRL